EALVAAVAELRAAALADRVILADLAFGVRDRLFPREIVTLISARDFGKGITVDISQRPALLDEKIAGVDVAVVLHHAVAVAGVVHGAIAGLHAGQRLGDVVEEPDAHLLAVGPP